MTWDDYNKALLALTMWREARGEGAEGMQAVGCVVRNRVERQSYGDWSQCITAKWQFSSLTAPGDAMLVQWPETGDAPFKTCMLLAEGIYNGTVIDNTDGATHYFNPNVVMPKWASQLTKIKSIGHHVFYK